MADGEQDTKTQQVGMCLELEVSLTSTSKKSTEKRTLSVDTKALGTVLDVKHYIQKQFSVPICVQDFTYESQSFADTTSLKSLCLRSGDTVHVSYPSDANCAAIDEVVAWLHQTIACMKNETPTIHRDPSVQLETLMKARLSGQSQLLVLDSLPTIGFGSFGEARTRVNKLYFSQLDGISLSVELLTMIQRIPCSIQRPDMRHLEWQCLNVLWSFCETQQFGDIVCKHGGLECCITAVWRKVVARDECLYDSNAHWAQREERLLKGVMHAGLGTLANLSELSTHEFLTNSELIEGIVHVCQMKRPLSTGNASDIMVMIWYQTCMFLAQLVLISWNKIASLQRQMIFDFMQNCVQKFTWKDIMNIDNRMGTTYETFLPYIRLFYTYDPENHPSSEEGLAALRQICLDVVITGLQATLGKLHNYMIVAKEGLLDYVTCIPFNVPSCLEAKARTMVATLSASGNGVLQPPSLSNLSKAKLAKMRLGLELVMSASAREIAERLL